MSARAHIVLLRELSKLTLSAVRSDFRAFPKLRLWYKEAHELRERYCAPLYVPSSGELLSIEADPKTSKALAFGAVIGALYLAPHKLAQRTISRLYGASHAKRFRSFCSHAVSACIAPCLGFSGRGAMTCTQRARVNRSAIYIHARALFVDMLRSDLRRLRARADKLGFSPLVRPNATSELFELRELVSKEARALEIGAFDYTKSFGAVASNLHLPELERPYHLTLSWDGRNEAEARAVLSMGGNVAVPWYPSAPLGARFLGAPIIDGDSHDIRIPDFDGRGNIIGLRYKESTPPGSTAELTRAAAIASGFVLTHKRAQRAL